MRIYLSKWQNKNVLVTGAGGFIGSHLVEELVNLNANVKVFLRYTSSGNIGNLKYLENDSFDVIYGDLRDAYTVKNALKDVDIVFHLASLISIPYSYNSPKDNFDVNINSILNILEATRELDIDQVLHTSTSETYGSALYVPIDEKHPLQGQSPYSASKISADMLVNSYFLSFDSPVATIRPFNNFGPRQSSRAIIPTIILQLLQSNQLNLGDITTTRDFLFVKDTVQGFIKSSEHFQKLKGEVVNLGTGQEHTMKYVAELIAKLLDKEVTINLDESKMRPSGSEVRRLCCNYNKIKDLIGWNPAYNLEQGLQETIKFYQEYHDNFVMTKKFV